MTSTSCRSTPRAPPTPTRWSPSCSPPARTCTLAHPAATRRSTWPPRTAPTSRWTACSPPAPTERPGTTPARPPPTWPRPRATRSSPRACVEASGLGLPRLAFAQQGRAGVVEAGRDRVDTPAGVRDRPAAGVRLERAAQLAERQRPDVEAARLQRVGGAQELVGRLVAGGGRRPQPPDERDALLQVRVHEVVDELDVAAG